MRCDMSNSAILKAPNRRSSISLERDVATRIPSLEAPKGRFSTSPGQRPGKAVSAFHPALKGRSNPTHISHRTQHDAVRETPEIPPEMISCDDVPVGPQYIRAPRSHSTLKPRTLHTQPATQMMQ